MSSNSWAFVHIPRTGGTSLRHMLHKHLDTETKGMGAVFPDKRGHLPAWKHAERPDWEDTYSFAVVRNPFDRAVSLWSYCRKAGGAQLWGENFADWVRAGMPAQFGALAPPIFVAQAWGIPVTAPQVAWLYPWTPGKWWDPSNDADLVRFFWQFEQGLDWIWGEIWGRFGPAEPVPECIHTNKSDRRDWRTYYNKRTLDRVAMLYREDLEAFEYEVPHI